MYYAVILAGGSGTRLWPFSRRSRPKQTLQLVGEQTMFQTAISRIAPVFRPEQIFVVTRAEHVSALADQAPALPHENFLIEPEARGTAPAIGLSAICLRKKDPDAVMAVLTADHFIADTAQFCRALNAAADAARQGCLVTLGIKPTAPSTGYGYIQQGAQVNSVDGFPVFQAVRFTEKPDQAAALDMVQNGAYCWNSGMFIWRVDRILAEIERQMPALYAQLSEVEAALDTPEAEAALRRVWPQVAAETIDYGVMENAREVRVIPVEMGWVDVGSWTSLSDLLPADDQGNTVTGSYIGIDTHDSLIVSQGKTRLIATIGIEGLIVVSTEDAVLICSKEREQDVKALVKQLEQQGGSAWL
ncbi:MAG: mannose-1-phosphate guanylyltransferase [Chloroflexi bacterium]|nr:mannose-1-phosphate guanylyltransferase [Chloroflexota bacterium]